MTFRKNLERMARIYEGVAIFSVERGSTTHRAGVRAGDILVSVNGRRIRHHSEYGAARRLRKDVLELVVIRGGRTLTLWATHEPRVQQDAPAVQSPAEPRRPEPIITSVSWRGAA
jgi:S1-C subfamily serine protease